MTENSSITPLIIQIQQAALNSTSSLTDALRKAKIACTKLGLEEFGNWVNLELNGYMNKPSNDLPGYRKLHGTPQAYSPYQGWKPIIFGQGNLKQSLSMAPIGMTIAAIEESVRNAKSDGIFGFPYPPEIENELCQSMNWGNANCRIALTVPQVYDILNAVRNILLDWTTKMEVQGVLGEGLTFSPEEKGKSEAITSSVTNNFHIGNVGALVQNADKSVVQGSVNSSTTISVSDVRNLIQQIEQILPTADFSKTIKDETQNALTELKNAAANTVLDESRLRKALKAVKNVLAPAGENLLRIGIDAAITKLLGS